MIHELTYVIFLDDRKTNRTVHTSLRNLRGPDVVGEEVAEEAVLLEMIGTDGMTGIATATETIDTVTISEDAAVAVEEEQEAEEEGEEGEEEEEDTTTDLIREEISMDLLVTILGEDLQLAFLDHLVRQVVTLQQRHLAQLHK